eukprot:6208039-Pleurochrysis_carterae.AAC.1
MARTSPTQNEISSQNAKGVDNRTTASALTLLRSPNANRRNFAGCVANTIERPKHSALAQHPFLVTTRLEIIWPA